MTIVMRSAVNVRPYRYPYFQKQEIENQVDCKTGLFAQAQAPSHLLLSWSRKKMVLGDFVWITALST